MTDLTSRPNIDAERAEQEIKEYLSLEMGASKGQITLDTRLCTDLGIDGDDGHEFLEWFFENFAIPTKDINSFNYFDGEPPLSSLSNLYPLVCRVSPKLRRQVLHATRGRQEITVDTLVRSVVTGKWVRSGIRRDDLGLDVPLKKFLRNWLVFWLAIYLAIVAALWVFDGAGLYDLMKSVFLLFICIISIGQVFTWVMTFWWLRRLDRAATEEGL